MFALIARNSSKRQLAPSAVLHFVVILSWCLGSQAQEPPPLTRNHIAWSRQFLRVLYPALNDKNYSLTIESSLPYDRSAGSLSWLMLSIGTGPKFTVSECCFGGYANTGTLVSPQLPAPPELPPSPTGAQSPAKPLPPPPEVDSSGATHPKQYLGASFQFDKDGHLVGFSADGPFINDRKGDNEVYEIVRAHPEMTYAQVVATMKQHGTRYGPEDRDLLIKDAPWKELEPFLGKLQIMSVSVPLMDKEPNPVPWVNRWLSPDWTVKAEGTLKDGAKVPYELTFSHLNGYLIGLLDCHTSPWCHKD